MLEIFCGFGGGDWFGAHGEECADEQNGGADQLGVGEAFVENPSRKRERAERAEELKRLGQGDADFLNGDVIEYVSESDADHGRDNQNQIHVGGDLKWRADFSKN